MKNILFLFCVFLSCLNNFFIVNADTNYIVKTYVLMDGHNGEVLEDKDAHLIRSVASISKIMTAIFTICPRNVFTAFLS